MNGQTRRIQVKNTSVKATKIANRKATKGNVSEVGSPLQGKLSNMAVKIGQKVEENDPLFIIEAMKMETTIASARSGKIKTVHLPEGVMVDQDDLVIEFED